MAIKDMYYTVSEAAKELDTSRQTIYRWIANNKIPIEKIGGVVLVEKKAVDEYAADRFTKAMIMREKILSFSLLMRMAPKKKSRWAIPNLVLRALRHNH